MQSKLELMLKLRSPAVPDDRSMPVRAFGPLQTGPTSWLGPTKNFKVPAREKFKLSVASDVRTRPRFRPSHFGPLEISGAHTTLFKMSRKQV